jgi:hypothetical protein
MLVGAQVLRHSFIASANALAAALSSGRRLGGGVTAGATRAWSTALADDPAQLKIM